MEEEPVDRLQHLSNAVRTLVFGFFSCLSRVSCFGLMSFSALGLQLVRWILRTEAILVPYDVY